MNDELFNIIERLANLLRQEVRVAGQSLGLQPVQQEALYYLSICNKYSDTTLAVTEYLGLTKGTVSQSLKILENKSLITRNKDESDKRITHLNVTALGKQFLADTCPPKKFKEAINQLSSNSQDQTATLMTDLLKNYQQTTGRTTFRVCNGCKYNQKTPSGILCGLTKEALRLDETQQICREYVT